MHIATPQLHLVLLTPAEIVASIEALPPALRAEVSPAWLERAREARLPDPWIHGFVMVEQIGGATVGNCGFKGPPDADGAVEIAYGVDVSQQGRGFATEAAAGLVEFAFSQPGVRLVCAHTLPFESPSTSVLRKCGFERVGEVVDPEDGPVWRWERRRLGGDPDGNMVSGPGGSYLR